MTMLVHAPYRPRLNKSHFRRSDSEVIPHAIPELYFMTKPVESVYQGHRVKVKVTGVKR